MGDGDSPPGVSVFTVVLLAGLTIFGISWVITEGVDIDSGQPESIEAGEIVYTSHSFGKIGSTSQDFRNVNFRDFTVGEARGDILVERRRQARISNSLLSDESIWVSYNASQPQGGDISFEVLGRSGSGSVFVDVNGETVFEEHLISSATPEIEIPAETLNHGMNNVRIGTNHGVFSETAYTIEDLRVTVNDRKFHDYRDSFRVYDYEVQDFVSGKLSFNIRDSVKTEPLEVYVNDRQLYSKRQVRVSPEEIQIDPQNADLRPGYNTIRFETDGEAYYKIENPRIQLRYLGNTETKNVRVTFSSTQAELDYAARENTDEIIRFDYQRLLPSREPMQVVLNNETYTLTPENGRNTIDIEPSALETENELEVRSDTTYQLNNLEVVSRQVEG